MQGCNGEGGLWVGLGGVRNLLFARKALCKTYLMAGVNFQA